MHPILFRIPFPGWKLPLIGEVHSIPIYSYGVMLGLSLVVGWYLTLTLADRDGLPKETMANCYVVTALAALVGSRLLYIVTNLSEFESFRDYIALRRGGLVAYGGFLGGYIGSWLYLKMKKLPLMPWADVAVPSLASGLLITRIGCYLFGCDFGKPLSSTAPAWLQKIGTFPHWPEGTLEHGTGSPAWVHHVQHYTLPPDAIASMPVHPTQIYESLVGLALLGLLLWHRNHQRFRGQIFMVFAFSYGIARFFIELVRDDAERGVYGPHLAAQILIPGGLFIFALGYAVAFAQSVSNIAMRRLTQVLAFIPAVVAYLALRPASFADEVLVQYSTSQWVAVLTSVAVSIAFVILWKAAEGHPTEAMTLNLDAFYEAERQAEDRAAAKTKGGGADSSEKQSGGGRKDDGEGADAGGSIQPAYAGDGRGADASHGKGDSEAEHKDDKSS